SIRQGSPAPTRRRLRAPGRPLFHERPCSFCAHLQNHNQGDGSARKRCCFPRSEWGRNRAACLNRLWKQLWGFLPPISSAEKVAAIQSHVAVLLARAHSVDKLHHEK